MQPGADSQPFGTPPDRFNAASGRKGVSGRFWPLSGMQNPGAGGFGTVYLGHDTQLDRPVAIKVLHGSPNVQQRRSESFFQEARRVAQLRHSGIVAVHDVGEQDGLVYIVSDFIDGQGLDAWLKSHRPNWREATRLAAAVADALAHAHANSTVHRDVKPANIILTPDGTPVLVDFGLGLDELTTAGSELGIVSGTPVYMSPEQVSGTAHRIDGRTDIYSLGVMLYEMLCGRLPFRAKEASELLRQVRHDEPQPLRQLIRDLPPELERICLKSLAKRMQDRHSSAADFADDLRRGFDDGRGAGRPGAANRDFGWSIPGLRSNPSRSRRPQCRPPPGTGLARPSAVR